MKNGRSGGTAARDKKQDGTDSVNQELIEEIQIKIDRDSARLNKLTDESNRIIRRIASYQSAIKSLQSVDKSEKSADPSCWNKNYPMTHLRMTETILRSEGRPMKIRQIVEKMVACGHKLPQNPASIMPTITTVVSRETAIFRRVARGLWTLADLCPEDHTHG